MKLGIVGTGKIVGEALAALRQVEELQVQAICSRPHSREKAEALADAYEIPEVYTDYAELLARPLDFVYIGLVNSAHYAYARQAILAGRNVILEKPFTSTAAEAEALAALARERHVYIFEAVSFLYMPNFSKIQENLPRLGHLKLVQCNYSQYSSRYDAYLAGEAAPAFSPELSGGALYDINSYNLSFVVALFGPPQEVRYRANRGFNGIDTSGTVLLVYENFFAVCTGAKDSASPGGCTLQGDKGYICVKGAPNEMTNFELCLSGGRAETQNYNAYEHRMVHEFKAFAALYAAGDWQAHLQALERSVKVAHVLEAARRDAGISFAADAALDR